MQLGKNFKAHFCKFLEKDTDVIFARLNIISVLSEEKGLQEKTKEGNIIQKYYFQKKDKKLCILKDVGKDMAFSIVEIHKIPKNAVVHNFPF